MTFFCKLKNLLFQRLPLVLKTVFRFEIVIKSKVGICKINQLYHFKAPLVLYLIHYMHMEFAFVYPRKLKFKKISEEHTSELKSCFVIVCCRLLVKNNY